MRPRHAAKPNSDSAGAGSPHQLAPGASRCNPATHASVASTSQLKMRRQSRSVTVATPRASRRMTPHAVPSVPPASAMAATGTAGTANAHGATVRVGSAYAARYQRRICAASGHGERVSAATAIGSSARV